MVSSGGASRAHFFVRASGLAGICGPPSALTPASAGVTGHETAKSPGARRMSIAFTFPGQGSQSVGMGKDLADAFPEARKVFQEVDDALGENLSRVIWEGPDDVLMLTANAQPALMAVSLAAFRALEARG